MKPAAKFALAAILIPLLIAAPMLAQDTSQSPPPNPGNNPSQAPSDKLPNAPSATETENKTAGQETKPENKTEPSLQDLGFPPEQTRCEKAGVARQAHPHLAATPRIRFKSVRWVCPQLAENVG